VTPVKIHLVQADITNYTPEKQTSSCHDSCWQVLHQVSHRTRLDYQPQRLWNTAVHKLTHQTSESQQVVSQHKFLQCCQKFVDDASSVAAALVCLSSSHDAERLCWHRSTCSVMTVACRSPPRLYDQHSVLSLHLCSPQEYRCPLSCRVKEVLSPKFPLLHYLLLWLVPHPFHHYKMSTTSTTYNAQKMQLAHKAYP